MCNVVGWSLMFSAIRQVCVCIWLWGWVKCLAWSGRCVCVYGLELNAGVYVGILVIQGVELDTGMQMLE